MPKINDKHTRTNRRDAAEERQKKYDALSTAEKIKLAQSRRGNSAREISRLTADIAAYELGAE